MSITLHSEHYEVTINTVGAELKSFKDSNGKEFIWNSDPAFWMRSSPLLFPTIGNVRNNETCFNEKKYTMPKHGFCKDMVFEVTDRSENSATFTLKATKETLAFYPFLFKLSLTYSLNKNVLQMVYSVTNEDSKEMPYHIGAHPGFICPLETNEILTDYQIIFEKEEELKATPYDLEQLCFLSGKQVSFGKKSTTLPLTAEMFDNDAVFFPQVNSRSVKLVHASHNRGIKLDYPGFHSIAFWTPIGGKAPFLCMEPWNGAAIYDDEDDYFINKRNLETLAPGENKQYHLTISLLGY